MTIRFLSPDIISKRKSSFQTFTCPCPTLYIIVFKIIVQINRTVTSQNDNGHDDDEDKEEDDDPSYQLKTPIGRTFL